MFLGVYGRIGLWNVVEGIVGFGEVLVPAIQPALVLRQSDAGPAAPSPFGRNNGRPSALRFVI